MSQILTVTAQSLRTLPQRWGAALVAIIGIAGVVTVFVSVLSIAAGFEKTLTAGGSPDNVIVLRSGSSSELDSIIGGDQARLIKEAPGLAQRDGQSIASGEVYVMVNLPSASTGGDANVTLRGVEPAATQVRGRIEILDGRMFQFGRKELIAGRGAAGKFAGLSVGSEVLFGSDRWRVTGIFSAAGGVAESELWADVRAVRDAFRRGNSFGAVYGRLQDADRFDEFRDALTSDPRLTVDVLREREFYAQQSSALSSIVRGFGYVIAILMAMGAVFGAVNTLYSVVSDRSREIATLRAIGFGATPIVVSVMVEALLLALIGGLIGGLLAYLVFNGYTASTLSFSSFSQVVFNFAVTPQLLTQGIFMALIIGAIGGLLPAVRAARLPVTEALRA